MRVEELVNELKRLPKNYDINMCISIYNNSSEHNTDLILSHSIYGADIKKVIVDNQDMLVTIYGVN